MTLRTPSSTACRKRCWASAGEGWSPPSLSAAAMRGHRLQREPRADRVGAVAEQRGEMVRLARLVARDDQRRARSQARGDQPVVDGAGGEQRRDRRPLRAGALVGDEQELGACLDRGLRLVTEAGARRLEPFVLVERSIERSEGEPRECIRKEEEGLELDDVRRLGNLGQERLARAEQRAQRHDVPLPEVVDGRVGDLRKALLEIAEDRSRPACERRQRGVVAHRGRRLVPVGGQRPQDERELLARVAARDLTLQKIGLGRVDRLAGPLAPQALLHPGSVRTAHGEDALDRPVLLETAVAGVDRDRLAGPEPPAADTQHPREAGSRPPRTSRRRGGRRRPRTGAGGARCGRGRPRPRGRP